MTSHALGMTLKELRRPAEFFLGGMFAWVLVAGLGCAGAPDVRPLTGPAAPTIDPDNVVVLLQELIRAAPQNPPGAENQVVQLVETRAQFAGIETERAPFAKGRDNILLRLPATVDKPGRPILLVAHSDVVPANPDEWSAPPFAAEVRGDELYGRGSLDMLGMLALDLEAVVALAQSSAPRHRPVWFVVAGDEEVDGLGMQAALTTWPALREAEVAFNEGAMVVQDLFHPGEDVWTVAVAERGLMQFTLTTTGESGHGSRPGPDDAPARLTRAMQSVLAREDPLTLTDETRVMFAEMGRARGGVSGLLMQVPPLLGVFGASSLEENPAMRVLVHNTCALTMMDAGYKRNVIPDRASATFDCRILSSVTPGGFRDELLLLIDDPKVTLTVDQAFPANGSAPDAPVLAMVRGAAADEPTPTSLAPLLSPGTTDSRFLRRVGVPSYGLVPIRATLEEIAAIHGKDERVRVSELKRAVVRWVRLLTAIVNEPGPLVAPADPAGSQQQ